MTRDFRAEVSSLRFPPGVKARLGLGLLHDTTTKCHVGSSHPGCCTGAKISLRYEFSQQYHVNAKRPHVLVRNRSAGRLERVVDV